MIMDEVQEFDQLEAQLKARPFTEQLKSGANEPGHEFYGNQHTGGAGGSSSTADQLRASAAAHQERVGNRDMNRQNAGQRGEQGHADALRNAAGRIESGNFATPAHFQEDIARSQAAGRGAATGEGRAYHSGYVRGLQEAITAIQPAKSGPFTDAVKAVLYAETLES
jgi:hypothetical protein